MKSIKPGRGPSMMSGVMCIIVGVFGVIWTIGAVSMGAGPIFALFGIVFIGVAVVNGIFLEVETAIPEYTSERTSKLPSAAIP